MDETKNQKQIEGSIFKFLSAVFKKHGVQEVLVGGYALIAHKVQRFTFDIDFMITREAAIKIEPDLINAGYVVQNRQEAFIQFKSGNPGIRDIDFLITSEVNSPQLAAVPNYSYPLS